MLFPPDPSNSHMKSGVRSCRWIPDLVFLPMPPSCPGSLANSFAICKDSSPSSPLPQEGAVHTSHLRDLLSRSPTPFHQHPGLSLHLLASIELLALSLPSPSVLISPLPGAAGLLLPVSQAPGKVSVLAVCTSPPTHPAGFGSQAPLGLLGALSEAVSGSRYSPHSGTQQ